MIRWLPILIWLVVICYLSFSSLENIPTPTFFSADKIGHIGMYLILELCFLIPMRNFKQIKIATIFAVLFAASTELIQHYFIFNRYGEWLDLVANLVGLSLGFFIVEKRIKN